MKDNLHSRQFQAFAIKSLFDDIIDRHAEAYLSAYPEVKEFSNFEKSGTSNYYIGIVWANDFEKPLQLEANSIRVRGSKAITNNKLVELDLDTILGKLVGLKAQESFFPGRVIAFKAEPFLKRQLTVTKILDPMKIAPQLKSIHTHDKIVLAAASGPFMRPDEEDWTLFDKIIASVREHAITHLILTGPFVDMNNKLCKANYELYWKSFTDKLIEGLYDHECQIYIVPSNRDLLPSTMQASYLYPCPKLNLRLNLKEDSVLKCKINFVTDPAQIDVDGIFIDVTSADVAFQMSRCLSFMNRTENMLTTIFRHLITHGIYPMYPSHPELAVDYPNLREFIQLDRLGAHILVIPNQLGVSSVHAVEGRLVVATKRCTLGKQLIIVEIPPTSGDEGQLNSIAGAEKHVSRIIDLIPKSSTIETQGGDSLCPIPKPGLDKAIDGSEMAAASVDSSAISPDTPMSSETR